MKISTISAVLLIMLMFCAEVFAQNGPYNPFSPGLPGYGVGPQSPYNPLATDPPKIYDSQGVYRGEYSSSVLRPDSISNGVSRFGNPMSPDSIFNPLNTFGGPFQADPWYPTEPMFMAPAYGR